VTDNKRIKLKKIKKRAIYLTMKGFVIVKLTLTKETSAIITDSKLNKMDICIVWDSNCRYLIQTAPYVNIRIIMPCSYC
jgi:hypothetical protein